jgi:hypothetical protein
VNANQVAAGSLETGILKLYIRKQQLFIGFITHVRIKQNDIYSDGAAFLLDPQSQKKKISTE